jgi:2-polyprenyl-3-methyl-5-hydroxy-6-metoxy-1,4-benzoquinol methylase
MNDSEILINQSIDKLSLKLGKLNLDDLNISEYNRKYLKDYINNLSFFMPLYKGLLEKVINKLSKPIIESSFVDYGGGCGLLSFLAIELGFEKVIYNDIYQVSVNDVKVISKALNLKIDYFVSGDVSQFTSFINQNKIKVDHICSFDVLEHIYDLEDWFTNINKIPKPFSLCFMTSANSSNPYLNRKLKKIHYKAEYIGSNIHKGWKERDSNLPFLEIRKNIISKNITNVSQETIIRLAKNTKGLFGADILKHAKKQLNTINFKDKNKYTTNTCDPLTGNWAEHIININTLRKKIENKNTSVQFTNSSYSYSDNRILNIPKFIMNLLMRIFGKQNLFFSPSYTLEVTYKRDDPRERK